MAERSEALMRIVVGIVSGILLEIGKIILQLAAVVHWIVVMVSGKRHRGIANFSEIWNTQIYVYLRYMTFVSNQRPFPFNRLEKNMSKFEK